MPEATFYFLRAVSVAEVARSCASAWSTDIVNRFHSPARSITQRAGDVSFAVTGDTLQYNVMPFFNVLAGSKPQMCFVQFVVLVVLDFLHDGRRNTKLRIPN